MSDEKHLKIEDINCMDIIEKYGTPLFVTSESTIKSNYRKFDEAFKSRYPKVLTCFENKVNESLAIKKILQKLGAGADTSSLTELYIVKLCGYDFNKVMISGPKSEELIIAGINSGAMINVDNLQELETIDKISSELGKITKICLRTKVQSSGYEKLAKKHYSLDRCGIPLKDDYAFKACKKAFKMKNIDLVGFQNHIGSLTKIDYCKASTLEIMNFAGKVKKETGWSPTYINLGGGWVIEREGQKAPTIDEYAEAVTGIVKEKAEEYNMTDITLIFEPGSWISRNAVILLTKVKIIKEFPDNVKWVLVDASVNQLPRVWQSNEYYHAIVANKMNSEPTEIVNIGGTLLTWNDYLGIDRKITKVEIGDVIAFKDVGAYTEACESQYCLHPRPASVLVNKDKVELIRRKDNLADLISREIVPERLFAKDMESNFIW